MDTLYSIDEIYIAKPNTLCIKGWIIKKSRDDKIILSVNNGKIKKEIFSTVSRPDVLEKFSDIKNILDLTIGFDIRIVVNSNINNIKIISNHNTEISIIKEYEKKDIQNLKVKNSIIYNIDSVRFEEKILKITGWAFSKLGDNVNVNCENSKIVNIYRPDVISAYQQYSVSNQCGFEINIKKGIFQFPLNISLDDGNSKKIVKIKSSMLDKKNRALTEYILNNLSIKNIIKGLKYINRYGLEAFREKINSAGDKNKTYEEYLKKHKLTEEQKNKQRFEKFNYRPLISIVVPTYNTPANFLDDMIESVLNQTYQNIELCIADASNNIFTTELLKSYKKANSKIKLKILDKNYGISGNTNEAIKLANGEFIALLDHDDLLSEDAMYEVVKALNKNINLDLIYSDEDKIDEDANEYYDPHFKSDYAPDTLRSYNCISHLSVIRKSVVEKVGYYRSEFDGSQDYDMVLRVLDITKNVYHISKVLYHWRVHKNSVAQNQDAKPYAYIAAKKAISEHLKRNLLKAEVEDSSIKGIYKINYTLKSNPKVSIIIPNKDNKEMLEKCINSILQKSSYENYEIVVIENNSREKEIFNYYNEIETKKIARVEYYQKTFNYSKINNFAVEKIDSNYIIFLNNDIEIITPDWIQQMLMYAQRNDVAIVGAKLLYPNDTVQHAGVIIGLGGIAGHINSSIPKDEPGYFARAVIVQNLSAVTGACMMMKKDIFEEVDGFDENLPVAFNDVDICLKAREKGYLVVFTPYAQAYHYESKTRGLDDSPEKANRFQKEQDYFREKWGNYKDPYFNENFSLERSDYSIKI